MGYFNPSLKRLWALPTDKDVDTYRQRLAALGKLLDKVSTVGMWASAVCILVLAYSAFTGPISWLSSEVFNPIAGLSFITFLLPYKYLEGPHKRNLARLAPLTLSQLHDVETMTNYEKQLRSFLPNGFRDLVACELAELIRLSTYMPESVPVEELKSVEVLVSGKPVAWFVDPRQAKRWALDNHSGNWMLRPRPSPAVPETQNA